MSIKVSHLSKAFDTQVVVNDISFDIAAGEIVGFLGPNGAGKSTTMKMLTGYLTADSGDIAIGGLDIKKDLLGVKRAIGYLPESNPLYFDMYVKEYLQFVARIFQMDNIPQRLKNVLEITGLDREQQKKIGQLSKGYKQRVGLCAALIHDPQVLILDEPTSGLDPNQMVDIRRLILEQGNKKTILFSSHILSEVEAVCNRFLLIDKGVLKADKSLSEIKSIAADENSSHFVTVKFKESLEPAWLTRLPTVISAEKDAHGFWQVETKDVERTKKSLMQLALDEDFNIESLETNKIDLEDAFRRLTV